MMRMRRNFLRWSILGFFLALALAPDVAQASDCPPDDPSRADCIAAASTARSPLVPIAGAAAGGIAAWVVDNILDRGDSTTTDETETETEEPVDDEREEDIKHPCVSDENRLLDALSDLELLESLERIYTNDYNTLSVQWENKRQATLLTSGVDLASMAQSIWAPDFGKDWFKGAIESEFRRKMAKELTKTLAKEVAKDAARVTTDQGIPWSKFLTGPVETTIKTTLLEGINAWGSHRTWERIPDALGKTKSATRLTSFLWSMWNLWDSAKKAAEQMEQIRMQMREVYKNLLEVRTALDDARANAASLRRILEHCRRIWELPAP
jgi:hypothetical protein